MRSSVMWASIEASALPKASLSASSCRLLRADRTARFSRPVDAALLSTASYRSSAACNSCSASKGTSASAARLSAIKSTREASAAAIVDVNSRSSCPDAVTMSDRMDEHLEYECTTDARDEVSSPLPSNMRARRAWSVSPVVELASISRPSSFGCHTTASGRRRAPTDCVAPAPLCPFFSFFPLPSSRLSLRRIRATTTPCDTIVCTIAPACGCRYSSTGGGAPPPPGASCTSNTLNLESSKPAKR
mmetsp:Transcript_3051/g.10005  ORF Transcript_3051/g.10005 Transcript_3051/m.10005 type:complete len:246 (+) Transcript_3051:1422-2159(+)